MTPREFLDAADEYAAGPHEGRWRSAISRGYYAAFHASRILLSQCGFDVPFADRAHVYLSRRLSNSGNALVVKAGRDLEALRKERNRADYDLNRAVAQGMAIRLVQFATDILELLEDATKLPAVCEEITQAMRDFERDVLREVTWTAPAGS